MSEAHCCFNEIPFIFKFLFLVYFGAFSLFFITMAAISCFYQIKRKADKNLTERNTDEFRKSREKHSQKIYKLDPYSLI